LQTTADSFRLHLTVKPQRDTLKTCPAGRCTCHSASRNRKSSNSGGATRRSPASAPCAGPADLIGAPWPNLAEQRERRLSCPLRVRPLRPSSCCLRPSRSVSRNSRPRVHRGTGLLLLCDFRSPVPLSG